MNCKHPGTTQRALIVAIFQIGLLVGLLLGCATKSAAQTTDEIVAKVLAARGGLEKIKAVQTERISGTLYFNPNAWPRIIPISPIINRLSRWPW